MSLEVTEVLKSESSRNALIVNDKKHRGYNVTIVNETVLDRAHVNKFSEDGHAFTTIAHYIMYNKCAFFELSTEVCDDVLRHYRIEFPTKADVDSIPFEENILFKYASEFEAVNPAKKAAWRNEMALNTAIQGILCLAKQDSDFRSALVETGNTIAVEISKAILWGIDAPSTLISDISHPEVWAGENLYGQALTVARDFLVRANRLKVKALLNTKIF